MPGSSALQRTTPRQSPAAAATRAGSVGHASSPQDRARSFPTFTRMTSTPIVSGVTVGTQQSVLWSWVVKVAGLIPSPLAPYYMWLSTDHDSGAGGISLYTASSPAGPWTKYAQVFVDSINGNQSETPSVIWNPDTSLFHMYYQQNGATGTNGVQTTFIATSPDGITWTRTGKKVDVPAVNTQPGDGHTGYFQPMRLGDKWYAYSLKGGSTYPHSGLWHSLDGLNWVGDPRPLGYGAEWYSVTGNRRIEWCHSTCFTWAGRRMIVGFVSNFVSGTTAKDARIFIAPVADNMRRLLAPPRLILPPSGGESANYRTVSVFDDDGTLYLYYQTDQNVWAAKAS